MPEHDGPNDRQDDYADGGEQQQKRARPARSETVRSGIPGVVLAGEMVSDDLHATTALPPSDTRGFAVIGRWMESLKGLDEKNRLGRL